MLTEKMWAGQDGAAPDFIGKKIPTCWTPGIVA
jgi:hypothetical protein